MKHTSFIATVLIAVICLGGIPLQAMANVADSAAILQKIYETNAMVKTLQAPFTHHRVSGDDVSNRKGDFYYIASTQQMAMRYSEPEGRYFVVSDKHLYNKIGAIPMHFNTRRSKLMRLFGNCMVWAVRGDVQNIYKNNNVDLSVWEDDKEDCYVVKMTARKGGNKGISSIELRYDRTTCIIFHMEIDEVIGVNHIFRIGRHPLHNKDIDQSHFKV